MPGLGWHRWSVYRWETDQAGTVLWAAGGMAALSFPAGNASRSGLAPPTHFEATALATRRAQARGKIRARPVSDIGGR